MDPVPGFKISGPWLAEPETQRALAVLNRDAEEARIVGGAVRNAVLQRPIADVDIATTALPREAMRRLRNAGFKVIPTGIKHGTILAVAAGGGLEITTLREDLVTDGRHAVVAFGRSWLKDASRRDFTMNALYCDADGTVYDPVGGLTDCLENRVRFIGDPDKRLAEDTLRLLRFFRFFAAYGAGEPDPAGLAACIRARHGMTRISAERIAQETRKLLLAGGAVAACRAFAASGLAQPVFASAPNTAVFSNLLALSADSATPYRFETALAAFLGHGPDDADKLSDRLKLSNAERKFLGAICRIGYGAWHGDLPEEAELRHVVVDYGKQAAEQALMLAAARSRSRGADRLAGLLQFLRTFDPPDFPLRGQDLIDQGLSAGPEFGALLKRAEALWRREDYAMSRSELLLHIRRWAAEDRQKR